MPEAATSQPGELTTDLVKRAQQRALLKQLESGKPLSEKQLKELQAGIAPAKTGRGRPRRPVVPRAAKPPAAAISIADVHDKLLEDAKARAAAGKPLQNHHVRILRDAWLSEMSLHIWPSLEACAADLAISPTTVRSMAKEGCPGLEPHSPIPKAPVLTWLLRRAHERGGGKHVDGHSLEEVEFRIKNAKASKMERTLIAEAEDLAAQGVITTMTNLRHHLLHSLPAHIFAAVDQATDQVSAEDAISRLVAASLQSFAPKATAAAIAAPPAEAPAQPSPEPATSPAITTETTDPRSTS